MQTLKKFLVSLVMAFMLSNSAYADIPPSSKELLYASPWTLVIINGVGLEMENFSEHKPYMQFSSDGRFVANVGCNQIIGGFTLTDPDGLTFTSDMASTKMACPDYFMQLEDEFIGTLAKVHAWKIDNDKALYLLNAEKITLAILTNVTLN